MALPAWAGVTELSVTTPAGGLSMIPHHGELRARYTVNIAHFSTLLVQALRCFLFAFHLHRARHIFVGQFSQSCLRFSIPDASWRAADICRLDLATGLNVRTSIDPRQKSYYMASAGIGFVQDRSDDGV